MGGRIEWDKIAIGIIDHGHGCDWIAVLIVKLLNWRLLLLLSKLLRRNLLKLRSGRLLCLLRRYGCLLMLASAIIIILHSLEEPLILGLVRLG